MHAGSQAGSELVGGRFLCLKYCTTCWGSSASTALAKVSLAACKARGWVEKEEKERLLEVARRVATAPLHPALPQTLH